MGGASLGGAETEMSLLQIWFDPDTSEFSVMYRHSTRQTFGRYDMVDFLKGFTWRGTTLPQVLEDAVKYGWVAIKVEP
jgi:hypothetical protein